MYKFSLVKGHKNLRKFDYKRITGFILGVLVGFGYV
jgi:hypothetical protein